MTGVQPATHRSKTLIRALLLIQGGYYLVTGVWPLVSASTFQRVTGPKVDFWLVKTAGLLISVLGGILLLAAGRQRLSPEVALAGAGAAASLGGVDVVYSTRRRISPIYLLDGVLQAGFLAIWGGLAWKLTNRLQGSRRFIRQTRQGKPRWAGMKRAGRGFVIGRG